MAVECVALRLGKAYEPVLGCSYQLRLAVIVMWSVTMACPIFFVPLCQLFGGKSPPLSFARFPAWLCEMAAALFALAASHCVDDIIAVEPDTVGKHVLVEVPISLHSQVYTCMVGRLRHGNLLQRRRGSKCRTWHPRVVVTMS